MSKPTRTIGRERATSTLVALAVTLLACAPDKALGPPSPNGIRAPSADRNTGLTVTTIIPPGKYPAPFGHATAINEAGVVAGWRVDQRAGGQNYAFTWKDGVMTSLGSLFEPVAINRSGEIAATTGVWKDGVMTPLGNLPGAANCIAADMNDKGQVVGSCFAPLYRDTRAFIWNKGVMTDLGTLGGSMAAAEGINNHGVVVGYSTIAGDGVTHAFRWKDGVMTDLGIGGRYSAAFAINNLGEIAGVAETYEDRLDCGLYGDWTSRPFIWRRGVSTPIHFQSPDVECFGWAWRIEHLSDAGHVVGEYLTVESDFTAFVWHDGVDLKLAMGAGQFALSVNSSGQIAGYVAYSDASPAAVLWSVGKHGP